MGGGETSMLRLAHGLAATGLAVDLVVHTVRTRELPLPSGVNLLNLECGSSSAAVLKLAAALRTHRPGWLLSAFPHTNIAAIGACALSRTDTRCIVTEHAPLSHQIAQQGGWRYRLLPPLLRSLYRRADAVVAVSNGVRDDLQAIAGLALPPLVIRNPVLPPDFMAESLQAPDHPWLLDPRLEVVLSVCRLGAEKDLPTLLRAFAELRHARPAARLLLAGEGAERPALERLIESLGLRDVAQLPGRTDQPLRWMRHAAVFVLPSRFEGFGNVLVEALACGTPVVSTDCPVGPREVLDNGRLGALVPVGDVTAMAREICLALDTRALPAGAHEAALQYTEERACAEYRRLFERLSPFTVARC
jgi:glycosyltransferase involved in cell wall biosynthesis